MPSWPSSPKNSSEATMHELLLWSIPLLGAPLYAARHWWTRRQMTPPVASGLALGEPLHIVGALTATDGSSVRLAGHRDSSATVLVFMSNRCPGVKAYDERLRTLHQRFSPQGVRFIGVNSVPESLYPTESIAGMRRAAEARKLAFPYVKDPEQRLMRDLGAVCTPQVFVLDKDMVLRYRGRIDDSFLAAKARVHDLRDALNDVLAKRQVAQPETVPLGCTIDVASTPSTTFSSVPRRLSA